MRLWECIEKINEDKTRMFISDCGVLFWDYNSKKIQCKDRVRLYHYPSLGDEETLNASWTEKEQAITYQEAVKTGKRIKVEHNFIFQNDEWKSATLSLDFHNYDDFLVLLSKHYNPCNVEQILEEGHFYTE